MSLLNFHYDQLILQTIALLITAFLLPRFQVHGPISGLIMVIALSFINTKLWDAALFYSIPNNVSTQTIVTFFTNAVVFWILAKSLPGVDIQGFMPALIAPIVLTAVSLLTYRYCRDVDWMYVIGEIQNSFTHLRALSQSGRPSN